eukprot:4827550-Pyramimonas_sp.AAC.2
MSNCSVGCVQCCSARARAGTAACWSRANAKPYSSVPSSRDGSLLALAFGAHRTKRLRFLAGILGTALARAHGSR